MRYLSVCSGIEAATVAWHPLGWTPVAFSEIEAFPCDLLAHHYPTVPNLGDMTKFKEWPDANIDVLVGGTPCQAFSVAGLRKGLADPRGNLTLTYLAIAARFRPRWVVWENVPGVFSDGTGAFGTFLGGLAELGYMGGYRVLDAQYWGVAQRRRRPFVVGHLGDWRRAAAVLFELESLCGNPAPSREAGKRVAGTIKACAGGSGTPNGAEEADRLIPAVAKAVRTPSGGIDREDMHTLIPLVSMCLNAGAMGRVDAETETMIPVAFSGKDHGADAANDCAPTLRAMGHSGSHANAGGQLAVMTLAIRGRGDSHDLEMREDGTANAILTPNGGRGGVGVGAVAIAFGGQMSTPHWQHDLADTLQAKNPKAVAAPTITATNDPSRSPQSSEITNQVAAVQAASMQVRRLTPRECERLQGFPDDYTLIPRKGGKLAADGPRYKALGNSMAVPVMHWIGKRIAEVDAVPSQGRE